jgi:uncharacterized protein
MKLLRSWYLPAVQGSSLSRLSHLAKSQPLLLFFILAYAWSWGLWWLVRPGFLRGTGSISDIIEMSLFLIGTFGPTVAALATQWLGNRDLKICRLWNGWTPFLAGLTVGFACFFVATVVGPAVVLAQAPVQRLNWLSLAYFGTYALNYSTFLGGPLGEEPGWRGFALPKLQQRFGPFGASVILGTLWAGWHLPMFSMEGWTSASPWQFLLIITGVTFLLTAAANISRFNILVAILLHAFFNTSARLVNSLTNNLPPRPHQETRYTFTVLCCGVVLGGVAILLARRSRVDLATETPKISPGESHSSAQVSRTIGRNL